MALTKALGSAAASGTASEVLITETVIAVAASTITFSSIASSYRDLRLVLRGRGTTAVNNYCRPRIQFNGDTGSNYIWQRHQGVSTTAQEAEGSTSATYIDIGLLPSSTGPSDSQGAQDVRIMNYRGTTYHKPLLYASISAAAGNFYAMNGGGIWKSTSAITSLTLILDNGNYDVGTIASLYGIL